MGIWRGWPEYWRDMVTVRAEPAEFFKDCRTSPVVRAPKAETQGLWQGFLGPNDPETSFHRY